VRTSNLQGTITAPTEYEAGFALFATTWSLQISGNTSRTDTFATTGIDGDTVYRFVVFVDTAAPVSNV
jgi:hypothetical protein